MSNPLDPNSWASAIGNMLTNQIRTFISESLPAIRAQLTGANIPVSVNVNVQPVVVEVRMTFGVDTSPAESGISHGNQ